MKAFTIWQPWASLIMIGAKPFEFRSRSYYEYIDPPREGDRIVIHAGMRRVRYTEIVDLLLKINGDIEDTTGLKAEIARPLLLKLHGAPKRQQLLPLGAGLGTAIIGKPRNAGTIFQRKVSPDVVGLYDADDLDDLDGKLPSDSDRGEFNWAWPLTDIQHFEPLVPMRGMQGFWNWPLKEAA